MTKIFEVFIKKDIEEIPESARKQLAFVYLEPVDDALAAAFEKD